MSQDGIIAVRNLLDQIERQIATCEIKMLLFGSEQGYCKFEKRKQDRLIEQRQRKRELLANLEEQLVFNKAMRETGYFLRGSDPTGILPHMRDARPEDVPDEHWSDTLPQWEYSFRDVDYGSPDRMVTLARIGPKDEWELETDV